MPIERFVCLAGAGLMLAVVALLAAAVACGALAAGPTRLFAAVPAALAVAAMLFAKGKRVCAESSQQ